jgi:Flp pilus assembly protein TadG
MLNYRVMFKNLFKRGGFLRQDTGAAAVEFAFIMPFMLLLYFGLVDVTGLISLNRRIVSAAATMTDLVTQQKTNVLDTTIIDQFNAAYAIMQPLAASNIRIEVYDYRFDGTTTQLVWKMSNNQGPTCGAAPTTTNMGPLMTAGNDVVIARTCTSYTPAIANFMGTNILGATTFSVRQAISGRPRQGNELTCYLKSNPATKCT